MPRRIAGAYVFNFWRTCRTVHVPAALYMPSSRAHGFQVLHVLVNISYFLFVDSSHCNECEVGFHSANLLLSQSESLRNYLFTDRSEPVCWMLGHSVPSSPKGQLIEWQFLLDWFTQTLPGFTDYTHQTASQKSHLYFLLLMYIENCVSCNGFNTLWNFL